MVAGLRHRGPDGSGVYGRGPCWLGHTRLAIIDPRGGHQPLFNEDESVAVTFNGEIYNFKELRHRLTAAGHVFRTNSDTEVIVHAWEEWGQDCVTRFRGMFAFAIADWSQRKLFLARDHLGIKPLYYCLDKSRLGFASEPGVLKYLPGFDGSLDYIALDQYLQVGYIPAPKTAFSMIKKLAPGTAMEVGFDGHINRSWRYWRFEFEPDYALKHHEWVDCLDAAVRESVTAHLVSDVPFGAFLSGGMDSTLIVGYMSEILKEPVRTFSIGFGAQDYDETAYAEIAASKFRTIHRARHIEPEGAKVLESLAGLYGEPFGDASAIPTYYVSQLARASVSMVLSGDGGDEGLGGYGRYRGWAEGQHRIPRHALLRMWLGALRRGRMRIWSDRYAGQQGSQIFQDWMHYVNLFGTADRRRLWRKEFLSAVGQPIELFEDAVDHRGQTPTRSLGQYLDYHTYLPEDILRKVDVASMAHGLEVRTPLVDIRIIDLVTRIPTEYTVASSLNGEWQSKPLFRALLARRFDTAFINRRKQGFMLPLRHWFSREGGLRAWAEGMIVQEGSLIQGLLNRDVVLEQFGRHDAGQDNSLRIWLLVSLEAWLRHQRAGCGR